MPEKKAAPAKGTTTKTAAKPVSTKKAAKGDSYACDVCGLVVTVDEVCGCVDTCDIICCSEPMKPKKTTAKAKAA
jgi:hypothetical protein